MRFSYKTSGVPKTIQFLPVCVQFQQTTPFTAKRCDSVPDPGPNLQVAEPPKLGDALYPFSNFAVAAMPSIPQKTDLHVRGTLRTLAVWLAGIHCKLSTPGY